jgi:hypothetical protein
MKKLVCISALVLSYGMFTFASDLWQCESDQRSCTNGCYANANGSNQAAVNLCVNICNNNYNSCANQANDNYDRERICSDQRYSCENGCYANANGSNQAAVNYCVAICENNYRSCR